MGCGCEKRSAELEEKTGVPRWVWHAGIGGAAITGAAIAHNTIKDGAGELATIGMILASAYAFSLAWKARRA